MMIFMIDGPKKMIVFVPNEQKNFQIFEMKNRHAINHLVVREILTNQRRAFQKHQLHEIEASIIDILLIL